MKITKLLLPLGLSLLLCNILQGQNVSIHGKLDRAKIKTGEQASIDLTIRTNNLSQTKFYLKENPQEEAPYTVVAFGALDTINIEGSIKEITAKLIITSFDSTLITIPPIVVETPEGRAETEPMGLKVVQPEVDSKHPNNFKDIKAPWEVSLTFKDYLLLILTSWIFWLIICLTICGYVIYRIIRYSQTKSTEVLRIPIIELSPLEQAKQALELLKEQRLWEDGHSKEFYSELITILKDYIDARLGWTTTEMTSSELIEKIPESKLSDKHVQELQQVLAEADLSKFAKYTTSPDVAQRSLVVIEWFIQDLDSTTSPSNNIQP